jgi:hypothetical protein
LLSRAPGDVGGDFGGGPFGVRRPLRYLAYKLDLSERQVAELAQAEVDRRRTLSAFADAVAAAAFDEAPATEGATLRGASAERLREAVLKALPHGWDEGPPNEDGLFDAYSQAVVRVVERDRGGADRRPRDPRGGRLARRGAGVVLWPSQTTRNRLSPSRKRKCEAARKGPPESVVPLRRFRFCSAAPCPHGRGASSPEVTVPFGVL